MNRNDFLKTLGGLVASIQFAPICSITPAMKDILSQPVFLPRQTSDFYGVVVSPDGIDADIEIEVKFSIAERQTEYSTARAFFKAGDPQWLIRLFVFDTLIPHRVISLKDVKVKSDWTCGEIVIMYMI